MDTRNMSSIKLILILYIMSYFRGIAASGGCGESTTYTLTNNEYKGLVIAIEENVEENSRLLIRIKELFTKASAQLYTATKQRAFFKEITILVPKTWTSSIEYENAGKELYENSHIRVRHSNVHSGFTPFVKQFSNECGKQGLYMNLSPTFFLEPDLDDLLQLEKLIVHEFGHLRWGLYDEYPATLNLDNGNYPNPDPQEDKIYYYDTSTGKWEVNRCTLALNVTTSCDTNSIADCEETNTFKIINTSNSTRGSIMFFPTEQSVDSFCDDNSSNPLTFHNSLAPNRQNRLCSGKSAWAVMNESPDFGDSNPPRDVDDTTPTYRVVQQKVARRVVFVLDVSGSMKTRVGTSSTRIERMNQAASIYLSKAIDDCTYVGLVKFHSSASILQDLTLVKNNRETLVNALQTNTEGATCIGCGIQKALEVLQDESDTPGGYIFVISDGGENQSPSVADVIDEVNAAGVVVDALAFTDAAADSLDIITTQTGGILFYTSDEDSSTSLFENLLKTIECRPFYCESQTRGITVESTSTIVNGYSSTSGFVYIDSALGKDTTFLFTSENENIAVILSNPDGNNYDENYSGYDDSIDTIISIDIAGTAMAGIWSYTITNTNSEEQEVAIIITSSQQNSEDAPILVDSYFSITALNYLSGDKQVIFAGVAKGDFPVLNATVEALVETPSGTVTIRLLDNGAGADYIKDDGIYSTYVTIAITANGRYGVKIHVKNEGGAVIKNYVVGEKVFIPPDIYDALNVTQPEVNVTPADQFSRTGSAGAFTVSAYSPSIDPYPPSRIIDLEASEISVLNQRVTLTWTAVGSDLDTGTASSYDLRTSFSVDVIYNNFESAAKINQSDILHGNLNLPLVAGSEESVTILLSEFNATYAIALRAIDENGNAGDVSNVVQAGLFIQQQVDDGSYLDDIYTISNSENGVNSEEETTAENIESEKNTLTNTQEIPKDINHRKFNGNNTEMIIYLSCSLIGGVLIIGSMIYCVYKKTAYNKIRPSGQDVADLALQYSNATANSGLWANGQSELDLKEKEETISMFYNSFYSKNDLKGLYSHLDD